MKIKDIPSNRRGVYVWRYNDATMIAFINVNDTQGESRSLFALSVADDGRVYQSGWAWYKDGSAACDLEAEEIPVSDLVVRPKP